MIDTILNSKFVADGTIINVSSDLDGLRMVCRDGSGCRVNHVQDRMGALWVMDVWTQDGEVINVSATTAAAANAIWVEMSDDGRQQAMIYDVLFIISCLLRYGWWRHSVVVWDGRELRAVARDTDASERFVISIDAVYGVRFDEEEDGLEEDV